MLVDQAAGAPDKREVTTMAVLGQAQDGMDNQFDYWVVDCGAQTLYDRSVRCISAR